MSELHSYEWTMAPTEQSRWQPFTGSVWHLTSPQGAIGILEKGTILPSSEEREFSQPQTSNSYALRKEYVSLFDFREAETERLDAEAWKWSQYFWGQPFRVGFRVDESKLDHDLIPWRVAKEEVGFGTVWVPYFEAWSSAPIPIRALTSICVTINREVDVVHTDLSQHRRGLLEDVRLLKQKADALRQELADGDGQ